MAGHLRHRGALAHHHQAARAHHRAQFAQALVVHRGVEQVGGDAAAGGAAGLHRLHAAVGPIAAGHAAADGEHHRAQAGAHRHLHQAGVGHRAGEGEHLGALAALGADRGIPVAPLAQDRRDRRQRLHVVDQGGSTPEAHLGGERRPRPGRAPLALNRGQQRRFLPTHIGAGPHPHLQAQVEGAAGDPGPQQPLATRLAQGQPQPLDRQRILSPHIHVALIGAHRKSSDRQPLDQPVGIALQHAAVHEGTRVALVGVAHHGAGAGGLQGHRVPLQAGGIAGTAPAAQAAALHLVAHLLRGELGQHPLQLGVGAVSDGVVDRLGIHQPAALQHHRLLQGEERMGGIQPLLGQRVRLAQAGGRRQQGRRLAGGEIGVELAGARGPVESHQRTAAAQAQAAHRLDRHRLGGTAQPIAGSEQSHLQCLGTGGTAAAGGTAAQLQRGGGRHLAAPLRPSASSRASRAAGSSMGRRGSSWPSTTSTGA